jgi:FkbM family methyltransferase
MVLGRLPAWRARGIQELAFAFIMREVSARCNLWAELRDPRALLPVLPRHLRRASAFWPAVLPLRPSTFLDVGAYRGLVAREIASLYHPKFIGMVEPQARLARSLPLLAPDQRVFQCALGREAGEGELRVLASPASSSLLDVHPSAAGLFGAPMDQVASARVPIRTLDSVFDECGLPSVDLLKIDVQGYELAVIEGGRDCLARTRSACLEVSFFEHYRGQPLLADVYDAMRSEGFELTHLGRHARTRSGTALQADAIFVKRDLLPR